MILVFLLFVIAVHAGHELFPVPGRSPLTLYHPVDFIDGKCGFIFTTTSVVIFEGVYSFISSQNVLNLIASPTATVTCACMFVSPLAPSLMYAAIGDNEGGISFSVINGCNGNFILDIEKSFRFENVSFHSVLLVGSGADPDMLFEGDNMTVTVGWLQGTNGLILGVKQKQILSSSLLGNKGTAISSRDTRVVLQDMTCETQV
jgi:hypothetical protein